MGALARLLHRPRLPTHCLSSSCGWVCQCQDETGVGGLEHTSAGMVLAMARAAKVRVRRAVSCILAVYELYLERY